MSNSNAITQMNMTTPTKESTSTMSVFTDPKSFESALRMADSLASSTIVPKDYQKNSGNCLIAIEMAARINTSPMMVMQNLYIVNGRPAWSSQWIIAMINSSRRYKTELQFEFGNAPEDGGLSCRAWAEDYAGHKVYGPKITMKMANEEGWTTKSGSKWKTMPTVMIQYRAASFFGRMNCPDMIMGIYSSEEAYDMDSKPIEGYAITIDPDSGEVTETEPVDDPVISTEQRKYLFNLASKNFGKEEANNVIHTIISNHGLSDTKSMRTSIYDEVLSELIEAVANLKPNEPAETEE